MVVLFFSEAILAGVATVVMESLSYTLADLLILPVVLYDFLMENFNHRQSLGKMVLQMRVARDDGMRPGVGDFLLRWVRAPSDIFGGLGLISMIFSSKNQRLGDKAAGTMVIKETRLGRYDLYVISGTQNPEYRPTYPQAAAMSLKQNDVISRTLSRSESEGDDENEVLLHRLADKVCATLSIERPRGMSDSDFLTVVQNDYYYYASAPVAPTMGDSDDMASGVPPSVPHQ